MKKEHTRRNFLGQLSASFGLLAAAPFHKLSEVLKNQSESNTLDPIISMKRMGFQWETMDPFLFCVHHEDAFPKGNSIMGPDPGYFKGRSMGDDFIIKDGFRMYHGKTVPGFPGHPHRGFETVTMVRKGMVDHADSIGAAGRYGDGDVQWMTAGNGVQHSEMFPLINQDKPNPLELFQIWLNLPARNKKVAPYFTMLWRESIPQLKIKDAAGKKTLIELVAGKLEKKQAPPPPPNSWAADPTNEVTILNIKMEPGASWTLPAASKGLNRMLYFYQGDQLLISGKAVPFYHSVHLHSDQQAILQAGNKEVGILILQGKPIGEPVIQYGPFVMNTKEEINQAFEDYHKTKFGGWPWPKYDQVHSKDKPRFARHADGREEIKNA